MERLFAKGANLFLCNPTTCRLGTQEDVIEERIPTIMDPLHAAFYALLMFGIGLFMKKKYT
jgi:hypothetical protein